jgi:hypothetical protein
MAASLVFRWVPTSLSPVMITTASDQAIFNGGGTALVGPEMFQTRHHLSIKHAMS